MKISNSVAIGLIGLLLLMAYGHTLNFPFQFDDYNVIVDEPKVHGLSAWWQYTWQSMPGLRPILKLTYALNWQLEAAPRFFRLFNLICHLFTTILVWRFSLRLLPYLKVDEHHHRSIALLTALLFGLHPAQTEVVTYISSRSTGLMTLFSIISLLFFLACLQTQTKLKISYFLASVAFWILAMLVKEPAMILPLLAWLLFRLVHPQVGMVDCISALSSLKKLLLILMLSVPIVYISTTPQYARLVMRIFSLDNLYAQLLSQSVAHLHYLTHTLFGLNLNIDYQLDVPNTFNMNTGLFVLLLLVIIGAALFYVKRFPLICFVILWWFICLIPSNSIIPRLDLINDRQIYMASLGALLLIATGIILVASKLEKVKLFWLLPIALLSYSLIATHLRNWDYESEISLWQASIRQAPDNSRAWNNLGYAYLLAHQNVQAKLAFEKALQLDESNYKAFYNLQQLKDK